jgi:hypothetical protein
VFAWPEGEGPLTIFAEQLSVSSDGFAEGMLLTAVRQAGGGAPLKTCGSNGPGFAEAKSSKAFFIPYQRVEAGIRYSNCDF